MKKVAIIMGSDSDLPVVAPAIKQLKELGIEVEARVMSAHRTPEEAHEFSKNAIKNGFGVIIAAAGMAAHLGGVLAASTTLPVIGIPCSAKVLDGMDAMLATVMMPPGIPVATVGVNAAKNAALLAAEILAVGDDELMAKLVKMREDMAEQVRQKDIALQSRSGKNQGIISNVCQRQISLFIISLFDVVGRTLFAQRKNNNIKKIVKLLIRNLIRSLKYER